MERPERRVTVRWPPNPNNLPSTICFLYTILSCSFVLCCSTRDTITVLDSLLKDGETLVSAGNRFELGFFNPTKRSEGNRTYVGIWYYNSNPRVVVWVANRDNPLPVSTGFFGIADDGNLKIFDADGTVHWYTKCEKSPPLSRVAKLMDSGNLVLTDDRLAMSSWESFKQPTDTFLPGMKMDKTLNLTSWISQDNPAIGDFTFKAVLADNQYQILRKYLRYWESGEARKFFTEDEMPPFITRLLSNSSQNLTVKPSNSKSLFHNLTIDTIDLNNSRLTINSTGQIQLWSKDKVKGWSLIWWKPRDRCGIINHCGNFGICNSSNKLECTCLPGFMPVSPENWDSGGYTGGCRRKSKFCPGKDTFSSLKKVKVKSEYSEVPATNETDCLEQCRNTCQCQAYSYYEPNSTRRGDPTSTTTCLLWTEDLSGIQEEYGNDGPDLHVRVAASDTENGNTTQDGGGYPKRGRKKWTLIVGVTVAGVILLSSTTVYFYLRRKNVERQENRESIRQNMAARFYDSARHVKDLVETDQFKEDKKGIDLPFFDFESILAATDNFSESIMRSSPNQNHLPSTICVLYTLLSCSLLLYCSARDTITVNTLLKDGETLVSAGQRFELGFFTPPKSSDIRYVGIWYFKSNPRIVVWVANRESHLPDSNGLFVIANDGNLKVLDAAGIAYWSTNLKSSLSGVREAKLMDSGNLVLSDSQLETSPWQSFEQPTDTFLAGMKMTENISLRSWLSEDNPREGNFSFKMVQGVNPYLILKGYITYWISGKSGDFFRSKEMPYEIAYLLSNFSKSTLKPTDSKSFFYGLKNISNLDYSHTRLVMHFTGQIQFWIKDEMKDWSVKWSEPSDPCRVYRHCGNFGSCNSNNRVECKCLPGFKAKSPEKWNSGDFSGGCTRKNPICAAKDKVFGLKMMKLDNPDIRIPDMKTERECRSACYNECQCQAYSFGKATRRDDPSAYVCWIWTQDLNDLQEEYANGGRDIYVRVAPSDIESTERSCKTCGTNLIPYPLSTKPSCGDPNYFSFVCDTSTGQVSFKALSGTYRIARIDPDTRNFSIQIKRVDGYARNSKGILELNQSLPFYFLSNGFDAGQEDSSYGNSSNSASEVVIHWTPPPEPTCSTQKDCINWPHSTCKLAGNRVRRCLCSETHRWDGPLLNCTPVNGTAKPDEGGHTMQNGRSDVRKKQWILTIGVIVATVIVLFIIVYFFCQRKKTQTQEDRESLQQNLAVRFNDSARHVKGLVDTDQFREEDKKGIDLPFFDFESILAATDNFSEANKLGKGGFGPVYKGKFPGGQEIAVKRLSSVSGQGLEEFKNEVVLIARLQHRNLVKLLGYCVEGGEKILLYEYMPNKSLDSFIFDPTCSVLLDWEIRFNIILGIARGILYLHQDSRLRIIHRDLKTSNVLLDQEMNPKISDFGLARIFEGKQTEGSTNRVVGTYGYMSPEYALDGYFSIKSDVFSFGVVVLEIVSGKKNTGFYNSEEALSLLGYAWRLWQEDKALDIMDQKLSPSFNKIEILKCINVGLLCVQEDPNDRPTMSSVVIMLGSETATLTTPKRPAFVIRSWPSTSASSSSKPNINSELTVSLTGR